MDTRHLHTVFIIDDDEEVVELISSLVFDLGHGSEVFLSGEAALAELRKGAKPDAVLCDIIMPGKDGVEILREIRTMGNDVPFVFVTGYDHKDSMLDALRLGAVDFVIKPMGLEELRVVIDRALEMGARKKSVHSSVQSLNEGNWLSQNELGSMKENLSQVEMLRGKSAKKRA